MFIVFDGIDRAGKTTNLGLISNWLSSQDIKNRKTREPGGTNFGERVREIFMTPELNPMTRAFLMAAMRLEHTKQIEKWEKEEVVLCDRFVDSTYAYQGLYIEKETLDFISKNSVLVKPDFTFLFLETLSKAKDFLDVEAENNKGKIIEIYKQRAALNPQKYAIVPRETIENQQNFIQNKIKEFL